MELAGWDCMLIEIKLSLIGLFAWSWTNSTVRELFCLLLSERTNENGRSRIFRDSFCVRHLPFSFLFDAIILAIHSRSARRMHVRCLGQITHIRSFCFFTPDCNFPSFLFCSHLAHSSLALYPFSSSISNRISFESEASFFFVRKPEHTRIVINKPFGFRTCLRDD